MAEVKIDQASRRARDLYQKGLDAMQRGNTEYAIELFSGVIAEEPRLLDARRRLRICQAKISNAKKPNAFMNSIKAMGPSGAIKSNLKKDPAKSLEAAEKLMSLDPLNLDYVHQLVDAALAADMPEVAVMTMEVAREASPSDIKLLDRLGDTYLVVKNGTAARDTFQQIVRMKPNDQEALRKFKNAAALESMDKGGWNKVTANDDRNSYRNQIKNKDEAGKLELAGKAKKSEEESGVAIEDYQQRITRDPKNLNYYRELARLYNDTKQHDLALETLEKANNVAGGVDPMIERAMVETMLLIYDHNLEIYQSEGQQAEYDQVLAEKRDYLLQTALDRVTKYPNDLEFKYEYGVQLLEHGDVDKAIQQFQQSQRSPKRRIESLGELGKCFKAKGLYDLAAEQLKTAAEELYVMDEKKMAVYYELGDLYERQGLIAEALKYYKDIYARDIGFLDVAAKIQNLHAKPAAS